MENNIPVMDLNAFINNLANRMNNEENLNIEMIINNAFNFDNFDNFDIVSKFNELKGEFLCDEDDCICRKTECIKLYSNLMNDYVCYPMYKIYLDASTSKLLKPLFNNLVDTLYSELSSEIVDEFSENEKLNLLFPGNELEYDDTRFIFVKYYINRNEYIVAYSDAESMIHNATEQIKNGVEVVELNDALGHDYLIPIKMEMYNLENEKVNIEFSCGRMLQAFNTNGYTYLLTTLVHEDTMQKVNKIYEMGNCLIGQKKGYKKCINDNCWTVLKKRNELFTHCEKCNTKQCVNCNIPIKDHYINDNLVSCAQAKLNHDENFNLDEFHDSLFGDEITIQPCPTCAELISLADGCNTVKCIKCNNTFCWACGEGQLNKKYNNSHRHFEIENENKCKYVQLRDLDENRDLIYFKKITNDIIRKNNINTLPNEWNRFLEKIIDTYDIFDDPLNIL